MQTLFCLTLGIATAALVHAAPATRAFTASGFANGGVQFPDFDGLLLTLAAIAALVTLTAGPLRRRHQAPGSPLSPSRA